MAFNKRKFADIFNYEIVSDSKKQKTANMSFNMNISLNLNSFSVNYYNCNEGTCQEVKNSNAYYMDVEPFVYPPQPIY